MAGLNRTILAGRLTRDPEVRYTSDEVPIAKFTLAINRRLKNGENEADFINCVAWRGLAKICGEYLKKGKLVAVEGRLQIKKYEGKDGTKKTSAEVVVDNMQMLDTRFFKASSESPSETDDAEIEVVSTKASKK